MIKHRIIGKLAPILSSGRVTADSSVTISAILDGDVAQVVTEEWAATRQHG
jgi:hypothetical protein